MSFKGISKKKRADWKTRGKKSINSENEVLNLMNDDIDKGKVLELLGKE